MAQPFKGPRRGYNLRWPEDVRQAVKARADEAGMTMNDYLLDLAMRDQAGRCDNCSSCSACAQRPPAGADTIPGIEDAIHDAA